MDNVVDLIWPTYFGQAVYGILHDDISKVKRIEDTGAEEVLRCHASSKPRSLEVICAQIEEQNADRIAPLFITVIPCATLEGNIDPTRANRSV